MGWKYKYDENCQEGTFLLNHATFSSGAWCVRQIDAWKRKGQWLTLDIHGSPSDKYSGLISWATETSIYPTWSTARSRASTHDRIKRGHKERSISDNLHNQLMLYKLKARKKKRNFYTHLCFASIIPRHMPIKYARTRHKPENNTTQNQDWKVVESWESSVLIHKN